MKIKQIVWLTFFTTIFFSCDQKVKIKDFKENEIEFEISSKKKDEKNKQVIIEKVTKFLILYKDSIPIIKNYWFLCNSSYIKAYGNYNIKHKPENIKILQNGTLVIVSPIPDSYKITEGPQAEFNIIDDKLGTLDSYILKFHLTNTYEINNFSAIIRFALKNKNGLNKVSFKKEIQSSEDYLIEEKIVTKRW